MGSGVYSESAVEKAAGGHTNGVDGGKLCPLDHRVENQEHVFRHCFFRLFMFDAVWRAFSLVLVVVGGGGAVEPSCLISDHRLLSLTTTQGLVPWASLKAQRGLRCVAKYH